MGDRSNKQGMKAFLAVTDNDWFNFLKRQPELDEVNFWQPGGKVQFKALAEPKICGVPIVCQLRAADVHRAYLRSV